MNLSILKGRLQIRLVNSISTAPDVDLRY